jgi:phage baseplate assembly protein W
MNDSPTGLLSPLRRDQKRDFASGSGPELLRSKVIQALATEGETPRSTGELPWRTAFGSGLHLLRHQRNDDALGALAQVYVRDALSRWVPEVELVAATVMRTGAELQLMVQYRKTGQPSAEIHDAMALLPS